MAGNLKKPEAASRIIPGAVKRMSIKICERWAKQDGEFLARDAGWIPRTEE